METLRGTIPIIFTLVIVVLFNCHVSNSTRIRQKWFYGTHHPMKPPVSTYSDCNVFNASQTAYFTTIYQKFNNDSPLYYSYMTFIDNYLFVGAMNYLFKFNTTSIAEPVQTMHSTARKEPRDECQHISYRAIDRKAECQNHFMFVTVNKTAATIYNRRKILYMCVSMSHYPEGWIVDADTFEIIDRNYTNLVHWMCPFSPFVNGSYLYVDKGNPDGKEAIFWASTVDQQVKNSIISRTEILENDGQTVAAYRTVTKSDEFYYFFDTGQFVKMYDMGGYVYTFFRNRRHPMVIMDDVMRSYVGRVCKSDRGENLYKTLWTSYMQVQLQCKLPDTIYSYDEIQDVVEVGDEFYAIFTSLSSDRPGSVMCRYKKKELEKLFMSQTYMTKTGSKLVPNDMYKCDLSIDSRTFDITRVNLNRNYYVIFDQCLPVLQSFILFLPNVFLRELEVDERSVNGTVILYGGSNTGEIYQMYYPDRKDYEIYISAVFKPNHIREPVTEMAFKDSSLFVGYKSMLVQLEIPDDLCHIYTLADGCIHNPTCSWNVEESKCIKTVTPDVVVNNLLTYKNLTFLWPRHRIIKSSYRDRETISETWTRMLRLNRTVPRKIKVHHGEPYKFTLDLSHTLCHSGSLTWRHNNTVIEYDPDSNYLIDREDMLTLKRTALASAGVYAAQNSQGVVFTHVELIVTPAENPKDRWTQKFHEWCDEFDKYKKNMHDWTSQCATKAP